MSDEKSTNPIVKWLGVIISGTLMVVVVTYSITEYFDDRIPYSASLPAISGISILLFAVNVYYVFSKRE